MTDNERTDRVKVEVTQADRIAAAPMAVLAEMRDLILAGKADHYAEPFARHREQARREALEEICAYLRANNWTGHGEYYADAIERGLHLANKP